MRPIMLFFSVSLLFISFSVQANWLSIGSLNKKGQPSACMLVFENKQATLQLIYDTQMKLKKINFKSKIQRGKQKEAFKALKLGNTLIQFQQATSSTPKKIIQYFKKGRKATLITQTGKKVTINLIGFQRSLKNCQLMMNNTQ